MPPAASLRDRGPTPVGARGPSATPSAARGRGPRWSQPVRPGLTRLVAAPLLLSGAGLLAVALVVLPPAAGSAVGWALAGALVVHAAVVWLVPVRTRAGDLAAATAALTAVAAVTVSTVLVAAGLHAWAILLALPVLYATSMFTRSAAVAASLTTARSATGTALVLVDLDHVTSVDDVHGHPVGDAVLQHVGAVLTAAVRSTDAVVSRRGGDELAVLLPGCPVEVAASRAADLVDAVRSTPLLLADGTPLRLTVSVGVAHAPDHAADVRALYAVADAALYSAKRAGRDGFAVAGPPAHLG